MKRGQVTIFIIIGIIIVAAIALIFLFRAGKLPGIIGAVEENPRAFMESCIEEDINNLLFQITSQGGFIDPKNYKINNDVKATYLCYNRGYFDPCINQHPMLLKEISKEIENGIKNKVENCLFEFEESLEKKGYEVQIGIERDIGISLFPENVYLDIKNDITIKKGDETNRFEEIKLNYKSPLYDLANVAIQITNEETAFCYFDTLGYMALYPQYFIRLKVFSDDTKVYSIRYEKTGDEMNIAIRGCALI